MATLRGLSNVTQAGRPRSTGPRSSAGIDLRLVREDDDAATLLGPVTTTSLLTARSPSTRAISPRSGKRLRDPKFSLTNRTPSKLRLKASPMRWLVRTLDVIPYVAPATKPETRKAPAMYANAMRKRSDRPRNTTRPLLLRDLVPHPPNRLDDRGVVRVVL